MIIFIGKRNSVFYMDEVADEEVKYYDPVDSVDDIEHLILGEKASAIVVDITQLFDSCDKIADTFQRYKRVVESHYVFIAIGRDERAEIIASLVDKGFYSFVTKTVAGDAKEQLRLALSGYATIAQDKKAEIEEKKEQSILKEKEKLGTQTIAVVGCCSRIGTTTQALQIVRYLESKGKTACYLTVNGQSLLPLHRLWGGEDLTDGDNALARVRIEGVDMYYDADMIDRIKAEGYDYIVYDYGSIDNTHYSSYSVMEKDIRIVVGGVKPVEIEGMRTVYGTMLSNNTFYIFTFVPDNLKDDVRKQQARLKEKTIFASYTPDPFVLSGKTPYGDIIKVAKPEKEQSQRRGWFGKKK